MVDRTASKAVLNMLTMPRGDPYTRWKPTYTTGTWAAGQLVRIRKSYLSFTTNTAAKLAAITEALDQYADQSIVKDWTAAERTAAATLILYAMELLFNLRVQMAARKLCSTYVQANGNDATEIWTIQSWNELIPELEQRQIPIPDFLLEMMVDLTPVFIVYREIAEQRITPSFYVPWTTMWSLANFRTNVVTPFLAQMAGINHFFKTGLKFTYFTREMISKTKIIPMWVPTDEILFWRYQTRLGYRDNAANLVSLSPTGDFYAGTGANRCYRYVVNPWYLHCLIPFLEPWHVANNTVGCYYEIDPGANSTYAFQAYFFNGTRAWIADAANELNALLECVGEGISVSRLTYTPVNMAQAANYVEHGLEGVWLHTASAAVWAARPSNVMTALMISVGGERSHGTVQNDVLYDLVTKRAGVSGANVVGERREIDAGKTARPSGKNNRDNKRQNGRARKSVARNHGGKRNEYRPKQKNEQGKRNFR